MKFTVIFSAIILGACTCVGLIIGGQYFYKGINDYIDSNNYVSARGLSERIVDADQAVRYIVINAVSQDFNEIYRSIISQQNTIRDRLLAIGVRAEEIQMHHPKVVDNYASGYNDNAKYRYKATANIDIRTNRIDLISSIENLTAELAQGGMNFEDYSNRTEYTFTQLNKIKPDMVQEATKNARAVGEKFASDSGSKLGKIKTARQGQFTIDDLDGTNGTKKLVRVVVETRFQLYD